MTLWDSLVMSLTTVSCAVVTVLRMMQFHFVRIQAIRWHHKWWRVTVVYNHVIGTSRNEVSMSWIGCIFSWYWLELLLNGFIFLCCWQLLYLTWWHLNCSELCHSWFALGAAKNWVYVFFRVGQIGQCLKCRRNILSLPVFFFNPNKLDKPKFGSTLGLDDRNRKLLVSEFKSRTNISWPYLAFSRSNKFGWLGWTKCC